VVGTPPTTAASLKIDHDCSSEYTPSSSPLQPANNVAARGRDRSTARVADAQGPQLDKAVAALEQMGCNVEADVVDDFEWFIPTSMWGEYDPNHKRVSDVLGSCSQITDAGVANIQ